MKIISLEAEKFYKSAYDLFFYEENSKSAFKQVQKALKLNPKHKRALKLLGNILILADETKKAASVFRRLCALSGEDFENFSKLAFCYEKQGEYDLALEYCAKSAKQVYLGDFEKMSTLYALKIELLLQIGRSSCAASILKNAMSNLSPDEGQKLRARFNYLNFSSQSGILEFKKSKKA